MVTEFIEGLSLQSVLNRRKTRLPVLQVLRYGIQIASILDTLHTAGWVWRDCKPSNLAVTKQGTLRPFDFEGACLDTETNPLSWATPTFTPPEINEKPYRTSSVEDLYALGVTMYYLLAGRFPPTSDQVPVEKLRRNVPVGARKVVAALLNADPADRPSARSAAEELESALSVSPASS